MHAIRGRYGREWVEHSDLVRRGVEDEGMRVMETPPAGDYVLTGPELLGLGRATVVDHERVCAPAEVEVRAVHRSNSAAWPCPTPTPATALPANAPSGSTPSSRAFSSEAITSAAAPSLIPEELPAVTVPPSRKAGLSAASFSAVVSGRGCSSRVTSPTGTSSSAKRPASSAAAQRR